MPHDLTDRDLRQRDLVPPQRLAATTATVVGVGAVGRQVALQLAALGVPRLRLIDPDSVEVVNLAPQGYFEDDLGRAKVKATAELCRRINPAVKLTLVAERFRRSDAVPDGSADAPGDGGGIFGGGDASGGSDASGGGGGGGGGGCVFCCVDRIDTRRFVFEAVRDTAAFFADARMSGEAVRVLTVTDPLSREHYPTTWFGQDEAYAGGCTSRSTIFTANIAAGLMLEQLSRHLRRLPLDADLQLNLLTSELSVTEPMPARAR